MGQANQDVLEQSQDHHAATARQHDRGYSFSEAFRAECEARHVLSKPLSDRRVYLDGVGKQRGKAAREYLERVILEQWKKKAPAKGG